MQQTRVETLRKQLKAESEFITDEVIENAIEKHSKKADLLDRYNLYSMLVRSNNRKHLIQGIKNFEDLVNNELSDNSKQLRQESLYFIALGYYKLKKYVKAKEYALKMKEIKKVNQQGEALIDLIEEDLKKDAEKGLIGLGVGVGVVTGVGVIAAGTGLVLWKLIKRKK